MARDDFEIEEDALELDDELEAGEPEDNARGVTSGLVISTFIVFLLAFVVLQAAMDKWFDKGMFGG